MCSEPRPGTQLPGELAHELGRHARLLQLHRVRMADLVPPGLDGAALGLLMALVKCGPMRQRELAEASLLDPSTVSRYVGQLVRSGLVMRRPDPVDGRAVQLVATSDGEAIGRQVIARREVLVGQLLAGWSDDDARALLRLLRRLNDDMEALRDMPSVSPSSG